MKKFLLETVEPFWLPLVFVYLLMVLLRWSGFAFPITYQVFFLGLVLCALPALLKPDSPEGKTHLAVSFILAAAFLLAVGLRLLPLTHSPIPLGYDPGIYKYTIELYTKALPRIPEAELATWVKQTAEQGLFVLSDALHVAGGTSSLQIISFLFPLLGALLVVPVFVVTRNLFGQRAGVLAAVLYAVSYTQYTAFTLFYFKNVLGFLCLLLAIYALDREKYGLLALMLAGLGMFHRPELLLLALVLVPYFILHRRRGIVLAALGAAVLVFPFWLHRWDLNLGKLSGLFGTMVTNIQTGEGVGGGVFFGLDVYVAASLAYLPFALMGALYLAYKRNWNPLFFYFVISGVIVGFQLFFFKRFIVPLDIAVIILAAAGIDRTLLRRGGAWRVAGIGAGLLLVVATALPTFSAANEAEPFFNQPQIDAITWLRENTEDNAYVLVTSGDAAWVLGWSDRKVLAPGVFGWDTHSEDEWQRFFSATSPAEAAAFLKGYDGPVYIYFSYTPLNYLGLEKFQGGDFRKVFENGGAVIYEYLGGG